MLMDLYYYVLMQKTLSSLSKENKFLHNGTLQERARQWLYDTPHLIRGVCPHTFGHIVPSMQKPYKPTMPKIGHPWLNVPTTSALGKAGWSWTPSLLVYLITYLLCTNNSCDWIGHVLAVATSMFKHSYIKKLVSWSRFAACLPGHFTGCAKQLTQILKRVHVWGFLGPVQMCKWSSCMLIKPISHICNPVNAITVILEYRGRND